jgi:hypothetical protein
MGAQKNDGADSRIIIFLPSHLFAISPSPFRIVTFSMAMFTQAIACRIVLPFSSQTMNSARAT